jgi:hypothetical protein
MAKHWKKTGKIKHHRRHAADIIIIFDQNKIAEDSVASYMDDTKNIYNLN